MTAALEGGEWSAARPGQTLRPRKTRYPYYKSLGGPVWMGGKSRPHRDSIPDRPARSQLLYRLGYPAHHLLVKSHKITRYAHTSVIVPDTKRLLPRYHQIILLAPGNASLQVLYILCLSHFVLVTHSACFSIPFPRASNNKRNTTHSFQRSHVAINFKLKEYELELRARGERVLP